MNFSSAVGMYVGLFIGDALGAPLEFIRPEHVDPITDMVGGGVHDTAPGEWTDDGAMAMAITESYLSKKGFDPQDIADNFKAWRKTGTFGTRNYLFDIGRTTGHAIDIMTSGLPYMGNTSEWSSGNGSIMRVAPIVLANHDRPFQAVGEAVAVSLMTHGNADTVQYVSAFVAELINGYPMPEYEELRQRKLPNNSHGSIMHAYQTAWKCVENNDSFEEAVLAAVNMGNDADTVGAVTGMLAGAIHGHEAIPERWLKKLHSGEDICLKAHDLYKLGTVQ